MQWQGSGQNGVENNREISIDEQCILVGSVMEGSAICRKIVLISVVSVAVKCFLAWCFPFTSDEAYFALWGLKLGLIGFNWVCIGFVLGVSASGWFS